MPIARLPEKWLYYAHVPKCAGTAVEDYLTTRFGLLGLLDRGFNRRSAQAGWSVSPPQHMPEALRADLLPDGLFDATFATVRHPALRLRSVYHHLREAERVLPHSLTFGAWLDDLPRVLAMDPGAWNGHARPISDFVPEQAVVFRVEDGLSRLVDWLDTQAGDSNGPRLIDPINTRAERQAKLKTPKPPVALSGRHVVMIKNLYAADYDRFGYNDHPEKDH